MKTKIQLNDEHLNVDCHADRRLADRSNEIAKSQKSTNSPLCGRGCDTDNHNGGIGEDLLQSFIGLAFLQIVSQFLTSE